VNQARLWLERAYMVVSSYCIVEVMSGRTTSRKRRTNAKVNVKRQRIGRVQVSMQPFSFGAESKKPWAPRGEVSLST
jgi:hypothetical protein